MNTYIKDISIAFLGGSIALFLQWYIIRLERLKIRRSVLYNILEVYSNLLRIERIGNLDTLLKDVYTKMGIPENEIDSITPIFKNQLTEILFDDIVNELNEQSLHYKDAIKELAKDKPILAFEISHHASYLQIATENLDRFISNFKTEITEENQIEFEKIIRDILKENLISENINEIRKSILRISCSISPFYYYTTRKKIKFLSNKKSYGNELEKYMNDIIEMFRNAEKQGNF
jgi:hypothetical protein